MTYIRGSATAAEVARNAVEQARAEVESLYAEGRALKNTAEQLRQRNANIAAKIAEETEALEDKRARLIATLKDLDAAQQEADKAIGDAENQATVIRELAYDQARALCERAYKSGYDRGKDYARAQHAILRKYTPKPDARRAGHTNQVRAA